MKRPGSDETASAYQAMHGAAGPWVSYSDVNPYHKAEQTWVINTTELDLSDEIKLKNIIGYRKATPLDSYDFDNTPVPFLLSAIGRQRGGVGLVRWRRGLREP